MHTLTAGSIVRAADIILILSTAAASSCAQSAWVNEESGLKMRKVPSQEGEVLCVVPYDAEVRMLEEMKDAVELSGAKGRWAKVKWSGWEGWVFGGFLSAVSPEKEIEGNPWRYSDLRRLGLKGRIKCSIHAVHFVRDGVPTGDEYRLNRQFNRRGDLVSEVGSNHSREVRYAHDGRRINNRHTMYRYDNGGRLVYEKYDNIQNGSVAFYDEFTYVYDDKGNLVQERHFENTEPISGKVEYGYDASGRRLWSLRTSCGGVAEHCQVIKTVYGFDDVGNLKFADCFEAREEVPGIKPVLGVRPAYKEIYALDERGNIISSGRYNLADGILQSCRVQSFIYWDGYSSRGKMPAMKLK